MLSYKVHASQVYVSFIIQQCYFVSLHMIFHHDPLQFVALISKGGVA